MKRRCFLLLAAATGCAALVPAAAAEPVYLVTLPDKQLITLTTVWDEAPDGTRTARIVTLSEGYGRSDLSLFASVSLKPSGYARAAGVQFGPKALPKAVVLEAFRTDDEPDGGENKAVFSVLVPKRTETIPFSGTPTTLQTAYGCLGRQYDWARGGEQRLFCLLDFAVAAPTFYTLTLKAAGTATIPLTSGPVKARRLLYTTDLPYMPKEQRQGALYVGKRGEVLRCASSLFAFSVFAVSPSHPGKESGVFEFKLDRPGDVFVREREKSATVREIAIEVGDGAYQISRGTVNAVGRPLSLESPWLGRPLKVSFAPAAVTWTLAASEPVKTTVAGGNAWFVPFWFVTEAWETGGGPDANLAVGDKRTGTYLPLFTGQQDGGAFEIERMPDYVARVGGDETPLHRYRVQTRVAYELFTDGKRMVYFAGSDGLKATRNGWEFLATAIPMPKLPDAAPPKPAP